MNGTSNTSDTIAATVASTTLSDTSGLRSMDCGNAVNMRSLAQEVVSFYVDRRHPYQTHSNNIKEYLRGPIIAITARIVQQDSPAVSIRPEDAETQGTDVVSSATTSGSDMVLATGMKNEFGMEEKHGELDKRSSWRQCLLSFGDASFSFHDFFSFDNTESMYDRMDIRSQARLDAFLDGVALSVVSHETQEPSKARDIPQRQGSVDSTDLSLIEGLVGFRSLGISSNSTTMNVASSIKKASRSGSITSSTKSIPPPKPSVQLGENELITRIELYLRSISRVVTYTNDCVIEYEPTKALKARTKFVVSAFVNTVGTVRHVNPVLTRLLVALTKELLAVPTLSEDLMRIIRNIVCNYVHATSFASLAFLSSPESSADQRLTPAILKYLLYLQKNWQSCERDCDIELMLSTVIDPQLRQMYKTAEFQSIGHLLEVYQSHRHMLQNIAIPPRVDRQSEEERIRQAMKDISREVIAVNGSVLPRVTNRFDLIQLLTSALNIRPLYNEGTSSRRNRRGYKKKKGPVSKKSLPDGTEPPSGLSGNEADTDSNYVLSESSMDDTDGCQTDDTAGSGTPTITPTIARRKFPATAIVDLLTKRLLLAISRTGTMGDAYFVVCDLFGGEDVEVVASSQHHLAGMNNTNSLVHYHHPTTIDLYVRLSSVTIKSHASFDVYPKSMVGDCEPLIQIHATTTETIALQEIRSSDEFAMSGGQIGKESLSTSDKDIPTPSSEHNHNIKSDRILLERKTETAGYRFLSIRPALYEKVSEWQTTPS